MWIKKSMGVVKMKNHNNILKNKKKVNRKYKARRKKRKRIIRHH